jgi:AcrR family transcriptional regulator
MAAPASSLRQKHVEATRRRLRRSAMELFAEHGFDATTVDAIASHADVSPRTFFRYFATKDAVLFDDAVAHITALPRRIRERPADESPVVAFVAALNQAAEELVGDPALRPLWRRLAPQLASLSSQRSALADALEPQVLDALAARAKTSPGDLSLRAMVGAVAACVDVAMRGWIEDGAHEPFRPYLSRSLDACTEAFAAIRRSA